MAHLLTKDEAADQLRISRRTLERWIAAGRLAVVKLSPGSVRVDSAEVRRLIGDEPKDGNLVAVPMTATAEGAR